MSINRNTNIIPSVDQKLRIDFAKSTNYKIEVYDDTGMANVFNPEGYGGGSNLTENVAKYIFFLKDKLHYNNNHKFVFTEDTSNPDYINIPTTEAIQNRVEVELMHPDEDIGKFLDSHYDLDMVTSFNINFPGEGFKGTDFISNVPGAAIIESLYSAIIVGDDYYIITYREGDKLFLNKEIKTTFNSFSVGFYDTKELVLFTDLQDCLFKNYLRLSKTGKNCSCNKKPDNKDKLITDLSEIQLYLLGITEATKVDNFELAVELLKTAKLLCESLSCGSCSGGCCS